MPKTILTAAHKRFIRKNRLIMSSGRLAAAIGCSQTPVQRYLIQNGLTPTKEVQRRFLSESLSGRTTSTPAIDRKLKKYYLTLPEKRLAKKVARSDTFVRTRLRQLGLVIPPEIIEQRKQESRIKPGNVSFNKGKRQIDYMSKEAINKTKATRFKKGGIPPNTKKDREITIRTDKRGIKYQHIRISLARWEPLHRHVWEQRNGKIPTGSNVAFKDGDTMNCNINNLELITDAELMLRNTVHNLPAPIAQVVQLRGALNRQINKHLKKLKNEK